jgi:hypothetical protein
MTNKSQDSDKLLCILFIIFLEARHKRRASKKPIIAFTELVQQEI